MTTNFKLVLPILLASTCISTAAFAQADVTPPDADSGGSSGEIIVTGTRALGVAAAQSAAPIQVLDGSALDKVAQPNLNDALTQLVPSFTAQTQGVDMSSFSLSATVRGLSPNQTLVLVNGKRRHNTAILQVINSAFGGSAAPSIDLIPTVAVDHIEVLQDGAAAQYGSDAIAGVINIILKNKDQGMTFKADAGQYYEGDGTQYSQGMNLGVPIGDAGYANLTLFHRTNDYTFSGDGQFTAINYDGTTNTNISTAFQPIYNALNAINGTARINGGSPKSALSIAFLNAGYDFGGVEFYTFGDYAHRSGYAKQGYRYPNRVCVDHNDPTTCYLPTVTYTPGAPQYGMEPLQHVDEDEYSFTAGFRGEISGWNFDLSGTYADDHDDVYTLNSVNASMFADVYNALVAQGTVADPQTVASNMMTRSFYDGTFDFTQFVGTLDLTHDINIGLADPLTLALGSEYRRETFSISQGDSASTYVEGGQSFPGYGASDVTNSKRTAYAFYADVIAKPVPDWTVDVAGRFEHYSDFGSTAIGKVTTRYDFSPAFALRGTFSTGFRAPTLQESNYSSTNVGPTSAIIQLPPSSPGSAAAGFGALKPEKSINFSGGVVWRPAPRLIVSLDAYYIKIRDRIVSTGYIVGQYNNPFPTPGTKVGIDFPAATINGLTPYDLVNGAILASGKALDPTVYQSGLLGIQTFANGIDTRTIGLEFSARYPVNLNFGRLDLTLNANYNDNKITRNGLGELFTLPAYYIIEKSAPKVKGVFNALFTSGGFSANARATYYSKVTSLGQPNSWSSGHNGNIPPIDGQYYELTVDPAVLFDLELGYDFTKFLNISVGAKNIFDKKPEVPPLVSDYNPATWPTTGRSPYINGQGSINAPYSFGPYGTNGGYYYARLTLKF